MKVLIAGICGFAGSTLAVELSRRAPSLEITGLDNLIRPGSELNRQGWKRRGIRLVHGDIRNASDLEALPAVDWIIDAAANPSVLAGVADHTSSRQLIEHNLLGTINLLEFCKRVTGGFLMLSTSRVYSQRRLAGLTMDVQREAFVPAGHEDEPGLTPTGVTEEFSTEPPLSLYGASKLASEVLALEYATAFGLPVYVNRCGVLAGAGQFGKADQGIFSFWIHAYRHRQRPLRFIGFGGTGHQVRDCLHPRDLAPLLLQQMSATGKDGGVVNVGGGADHAMSLAQLTAWCARRFGPREIGREPADRRYDVPWLVLNSDRAARLWDWRPTTALADILDEIARHAEDHPDWLEWSADP